MAGVLPYAEYGEIVESLSRGLVEAGLHAGEVVAIFLANSWEFTTWLYHAVHLGWKRFPLLNPTYREREVRYQLENSGAVLLISDGCNLEGIDLGGLPNLRRLRHFTRHASAGSGKRWQLAEASNGRAAEANSPFHRDSGSTSFIPAVPPDCQS